MPQGTMWVCIDCTMLAVNDERPDDRPADLPELWSREPATDVTPGLTREAHGQGCTSPDDATECNCAEREYVDSSCDACGDWHAGTRHAFTYWA
jgi:hypothetical protein